MATINETETIDPDLKSMERQELSHLAYFRQKIADLRNRGVIAGDLFETIDSEICLSREAIYRHGLYRAELGRARKLVKSKELVKARQWAARARMTKPEMREAWELEIRVCESLEQLEDAIGLCNEAVERFPDMAAILEQLRHQRLEQLRREQVRQEAEQKRRAELGQQREMRASKQPARKEPEPEFAGDGTLTPAVLSASPERRELAISWSSVAGEFLLEHWQKLILCMAVLLIVVSSTVGAHLLLGEKLWSPVGKCSLAMVATLLFAALGKVLVRWGAERAGQMMLITTLIVVPIHFMLAGELRLVLEPSSLRLVGFAIQVAALLVLSRAVGGMLVPGKDAWYLTVPLILMSVFNATMARRVAGPWEWQFAAFQVPALVFLGAVLGLKLRNWEPSAPANRWFGNLLLGLLGFALVTSLIRTGVYALEVPPALYAVPVMFIALACVHGARWLSAYEPDARQLALMRLGGHVLAGLAFAMALARPPDPSVLFSGNTLATALLGLLLFGGSLRAERLPAYLYLSFAAVFLGYFGAYYFVRDLLLPIEGPARHALIWASRLPGPYRAINGLVLNLFLGLLALGCSRRWKDERLASHCHYLGLPFSLAACVYSGFEPRAAVICLSGYAVLDLLATRVFAAPRVQYLAIASLAAAAYFGSTLVPTITLGQQAIGAALIGLFCGLVDLLLRGCRATEPFRLPWAHGALVLSGVASVAMTIAMLQIGATTFLSAWCFLVVSLTAATVNVDRRVTALGYLAILSLNVAASLALITADVTGHWALGLDRYAIVAGLAGLAEVCLGVLLGAGRRDPGSAERYSETYAWPLGHLGLVLTGLAVGIAACASLPFEGQDAGRLINLAIALGACSTTLAIGTSVLYRLEPLAHATVWTGLAGYFCGVLGLLVQAHVAHVAPSMLIALSAAGLLLHELWSRLGPLPFREALLDAAVALVVVVMPAAFLLWRPSLHISVALAFSGLVLVAVQAEMPRRVLVFLALAAFLGVWLKGFDASLHIGAPTATLWFGLGLGLYNLLLLGVAEFLKPASGAKEHDSGPANVGTGLSRSRLFAASIPLFVIAGSFLADSMAWMNLEEYRWSGLILLLAAMGLIGAARHVRESVLVYVGLWHAVAGVACLSRSICPWSGAALVVGWLAVTLALTALSLWLASLLARKCGAEEIFWVPCLNTALGLAGIVYVMAVDARLMGREVFALGAGALVLDSLVCLLIANSRRWPGLIYATVACFASATYMVLLSSEHPDPQMAYVLGLNAVIQGLVIWLLGDVCRRLKNPWPRACALPLFHLALVLTVVAIPPGLRSPVTMGLVAVSFLLTVKSLPGAGWIYAALAAIGCSAYYPWLSRLSLAGQMEAYLVIAYALWTLGLLVRRGKSTLTERLGLMRFDYELPLFNVAVFIGLVALLLKFDGGAMLATQWTAHAWVPLVLSPLALGMVRAHSRREFVHVSLVLFFWGVVSLVAPSLLDPHFVTLALVVCSLGLEVADLAMRPHEHTLCDWLAIQGASLGPIIRAWWSVLGGLGILGATVVMVAGMAGAMGNPAVGMLTTGPIDWWAITASLVLIALGIALAGLDPDLLALIRREGVIVGIELAGVALLWWLGVAGSPLRAWDREIWSMQPEQYYPLVTALAGLVLAEWNSRLAVRGYLSGTPGQGRAIQSAEFRVLFPVLLLSLLAPVFTFSRENATTAATLVMVSSGLGLWAIRLEENWAAGLAGLAWSAAGLAGGLVVGHGWGWITPESRAMAAALGELAAIFTIVGLAGWLRQRDRNLEHAKPGWNSGSSRNWTSMALVVEQVAFLGSLVAAALVALGENRPAVLGSFLPFASIGALLVLSLFYVMLPARWNAEWLMYLAQACLVWAYVDYRREYPLDAAVDAAILVLFAFVDLGIAEVLERFQLSLYARPTRFASLALPVLPLVRLLEIGGLNDGSVFQLLAAGTFYAVACGTMQWKTLGYAAGVLYNAALWVLWGKMGWQLADHPQFYLVPVGLSAILFAESNRRDLGRQTVNTIRTAGLITTYLALAAPIWQFRSFGDWVALLLGSLLGLFAGIGLRVQTFVWLGLVTFLADVLYELGRVSLDHALAKWAIMLSLGIILVFFVALNEKKQIVAVMRGCYEEVRNWE